MTFRIEMMVKDVDHLTPENLKLEISSPRFTEEVETWKEIFGIEKRYKAICCSKGGGKYWYIQVSDEINNVGVEKKEGAIVDWINKIKRMTSYAPWADKNFLKLAFLEGCVAAETFSK